MATAKIENVTEAHPSEGLNIFQILDRISTEAGALAPAEKGGVPFAFRGIDGTVAHLSPLLRKYGVIVVPSVIQKDVSREPSGNKVITTTDLTTEFTFYAPDGTHIIATTAGLANDYADRSSAQAQSVAFRVALLQTFALPTHSPEPEQTGVEPEAPVQQTQETRVPEGDKIQEGRAAIKALAAEKNIDYVAFAVQEKLEKGWADSVAGLTKLYKLLQVAAPVPKIIED